MSKYRIEKDSLGEHEVLAGALHGIHSERARSNFPLSRRPVNTSLIRAYGQVKQACCRVNSSLGYLGEFEGKAEAIERACGEVASGLLTESVIVDALQGGAGTSLNMNINEVIANRALQLLSKDCGDYSVISPLDDVNLHQSTNDTFPTALKVAAILDLHILEGELVALQEVFQQKEKNFAHIVKIGRTQFQDAVLTTMGREMAAYAEAFNRDRWRVYKCEERLRVVNLGGTAIGTGLAAPRKFIFKATEALREITGIGLARAENLVECTQNADVFVEVSGILKACAVNLHKVCSDLRLMSSGPEAGFGELMLPAVQAGSSIMPGKVNPVIAEAGAQAAMLVMGNDQIIASCCAAGSLELNPFLPLVADKLLESIQVLAAACKVLRERCVDGMLVNEDCCRKYVEASTATVTALLGHISYDECAKIAHEAAESGRSVREVAVSGGYVTDEEFEQLCSPEAVCRLGF